MSSRFNIVNKPKKIETEEETQEEVKNTSSDEDAKKKMMKLMVIITGGFIIFLLILFICSLFMNKKYTYEEIELVLKDAAIAYFADNKDQLPTAEGKIVQIDVANLELAEKMKPLTEYTGEELSCTGHVKVEKTGTEYLYTPYLSCGDKYETKELYKRIIDKEKTITTGYGLYNINGSYIYRGEKVNNYVQVDKSLWRILKITPANNIVLIKAENIGQKYSWDDRYNQEKDSNFGINIYATSRVKETLEELYKTTEEDLQFLSKNDKSKLVSFNLCTGKRAETEASTADDIECTTLEKDQKIGLATVTEYMYASVDANCKIPSSPACQNYNYLVKEDSWWTATASKNNTYEAYRIDENGLIEIEKVVKYDGIRPVIHLNNKVMYKSGNGTLEKPYKIK